MSVVDMLAAARSGMGAKPKETPAARKDQSKPAGKSDAKKMSTADILAAARAKKGADTGRGTGSETAGKGETRRRCEPASRKAGPNKDDHGGYPGGRPSRKKPAAPVPVPLQPRRRLPPKLSRLRNSNRKR